MANQATSRDWAGLIALSLIWGASFMAVELALESFGPFTLAAMRIVIGAGLLTTLALFMGVGLPSFSHRRLWAHIAGMGLFSNAIPFFLLSWAQQNVSSGFAGITMAVVPLLVLPLAHFLVSGEELTARKGVGFAVGFAGVIVLIGPRAWLSSGAEAETLARLACVGAAGCYAIGSIITRLSPKVNLISFSAGALIVASLMITPVALWVEGRPAMPDAKAYWAMIYLGVFPTALATILLVQVIKSAGPSFMSLVNYMVPVWSVLFGVLILSEKLPGTFLWALGLILAGLAISRARGIRRRP